MKLFTKTFVFSVIGGFVSSALLLAPLCAGNLVEHPELLTDAVILSVVEKRDGVTQRAAFTAKVVRTYSAKNRHKPGDVVSVLGVLDTYVYLNDLQSGATCHARMRPIEKPTKKTPKDAVEVWDIGGFEGVKSASGREGIGEIKQMDLDSMSDEMKEYLIQMGAQNIPPPKRTPPAK